jgi:hypothetical protein
VHLPELVRGGGGYWHQGHAGYIVERALPARAPAWSTYTFVLSVWSSQRSKRSQGCVLHSGRPSAAQGRDPFIPAAGCHDSLGDTKSSLGDAESSLGDAKSSLGDATSSLGDAKSSLGDAESSLGDAKSSLGDAKSLLGDVKSSMWSPLDARSPVRLTVMGRWVDA